MTKTVEFRKHRERSHVAIWRIEDGESLRVVSEQDFSPVNLKGDSLRCGYCYLGGSHSVEYHQKSVQEWEERQAK